jgi:cytochrome c
VHPDRRRRAVRGVFTRSLLATVAALALPASALAVTPAYAGPPAAAASTRTTAAQATATTAAKATATTAKAAAAPDAVPAPPAPTGPFKVLVFSKTTGFRHDSIPAGIAAIQQLGQQNNFTVDATEDDTLFTDANLAQYQAVVFLSSTGDPLGTQAEKDAFQRYIEGGGGFVGIHAASDSGYTWAWYGGLVGAYFKQHPDIQPATVKVEDPAHPSTNGLPVEITRTDEWYDFQTNPRGKVHVLTSLDDTSYSGSTMGIDHPNTWCQEYDGGRSWYTGMGHTIESFSEPNFLHLLLGGIQTAAGVVPADCSASLDGSFQKTALDTNTSNPMMLDIAPDGRVFYIDRLGDVSVIQPTGGTSLAAHLDVFSANESGGLSLALDPDFATNHWIYIYYSPNSTSVDRLSRFTVTGDTLDMSSEKAVLDVPVQRAECCHHGAGLVIDKSNGNLWLSTGDNTNPFASDGYAPIDEQAGRSSWDAQRSAGNTNSLSGKLLRIHPETDGSYTVPSGNLFPPGTAKTRPEIYAMGFRNPFRIDLDPQTHVPVVANYGPDAASASATRGPENTVEWDAIRRPGNYGWPYCIGPNQPYIDYDFATQTSGAAFDCVNGPTNNSPNNTGLTQLPPPIAAQVWYHYDTDASHFPELHGGAPMAGPVYRFDPALQSTRKWPAYFDGKALFGEWNNNQMFTFQLSADDSTVEKINPLLTSMTFLKPMDMRFGPDGALYMIEWGSGFGGDNTDSGIYRVDYVKGTRLPVAVAKADHTNGPAPLAVNFSSAGSHDPDGQTISYAWDFGDGTNSTDPNPSHTYSANGNYTAVLTVTNAADEAATASVEITVGNTAPTVTLTAPASGGFFNWGDTVDYSVTVTDPEDGTIDCASVKLQAILGHDTHGHPLDQYTGCSGVVTTTLSSGHSEGDNVFYVLEASYTDKGGAGGSRPLTSRSQVILQPKRKQAEFFTATGRTADGTGTDNPGVQTETGSDTEGGGQDIGFIQDGDWWSVEPVSLKNITSITLRAASALDGGTAEVRWNAPDGPLLGSTAITGTGDWQAYQNFTVNLTDPPADSGKLYFVARGPAATGLFNVNWMDFAGKGVTDNSPPVVTATADPARGVAPVTVNFTGTATDPENDTPLTYAWNFGDGTTASTANATHTYANPGTYPAILTVTDARGGKASATATVRVDAPNTSCFGVLSDDFTGTSLDKSKWTVVREDQSYSVSDGSLLLPTGVGDLYGTRNDATNLVLEPAPSGAWSATTRVTLPVTANYQQAGILIYGDDDNYAKLDLLYSGGPRVEFIRESAGTPRNGSGDSTAAPAGSTIYLRLTSDGTNLTAAYSADGLNYTPVGQSAALDGITNPRVGVFALNGGTTAPVVNAAFDWFQISPDHPAQAVDPSDEFAGTSLDKCRWNDVIRDDPSLYRLSGGQLQVDTATGDIYGTGNSGTNNFILQRSPDADWTVETKVDATQLSEQYQQGGLLAYADDDNYVKLDVVADNTAGQPVALRIEFRSEVGGTIQNPQPQVQNLTSAVWYLRLTRSGDVFTGSYSMDGVTWTDFQTVNNSALGDTPGVGLYTIGTNQSASKTVSFDYFHMTTTPRDRTAPVTTATVDGQATNGWYTGPVTVTLTAADEAGGSGLASTEYQVDGATTWTPYTTPIPVSGDAIHQVRYRSTDKKGNVEATKNLEVKIDGTAPVTAATFAPANDNGWHAGTVPVTLSSTDAGSGVASIEWSLDGGAWTPYTGPVDVSGDGQHELLYRATDTAGNVETLKSAVLMIDATKPTVIVSGFADGQLYGDSQDVRVTYQAVDTTSGIQSTVGTLDGAPYSTGTLQAMYKLNLGMHELDVTATDKAGNQTVTQVRFFVTTSLRDMQSLLDRFKATSRLSNSAYNQLTDTLTSARLNEAKGKDAKAISDLRTFEAQASNAKQVPDAEVRNVLVRDADAMIVRLGGTASAAGIAANGGASLAGTGRLDKDATRVPKGGKLK